MKVLISQEEANGMFEKMIHDVFLGTHQVEFVEYKIYPENHFEISLKEINGDDLPEERTTLGDSETLGDAT